MSPAGKPGRKFLYYGCGFFRPRVSPAKREHICLPWRIQHIRCFFFAQERVAWGSFAYLVRIPCSHTLISEHVRYPIRIPLFCSFAYLGCQFYDSMGGRCISLQCQCQKTRNLMHCVFSISFT